MRLCTSPPRLHSRAIPCLAPPPARARFASRDGVDLNRNFPDPIVNAGLNLSAHPPGAAPETRAIMDFTQSRRFAASANLHEGAVVSGLGGGR